MCIIAEVFMFLYLEGVNEIAKGRLKVRDICTCRQREFDKHAKDRREAIFGRVIERFVQQTS